jgi:IS30 family transposase
MNRGRRRSFTAAQRGEIWDRYQRGESLTGIGRVFGRPSSSIYNHLSPHGGSSPVSKRQDPQDLERILDGTSALSQNG